MFSALDKLGGKNNTRSVTQTEHTFPLLAYAMKTHFYPVNRNRCTSDCDYTSCPERFLSHLNTVPGVGNINPITLDTLLHPTFASVLRSGDLIICHADRVDDLDTLITNKRYFEPFRILLILGDEPLKHFDSYHQLNPRFVMSSSNTSATLKDVVTQILKHPASANQTL